MCCTGPSYPGGCEVGAAGTYTVVVALSYGSGDKAYTLSLQSQRRPSTCRTLGNAFFSFASPGRAGELAATRHLRRPGQRRRHRHARRREHDRLPQAPRSLGRWRRGPDLQRPVDLVEPLRERRSRGLQPVREPARLPAAGGGRQPPAGAYAPIRCRTLRIPGPGAYQIRAYDDENYQTYAAVFDHTGHRICDDSGRCEFPAAGDYTLVLSAQATDTVIDNDVSYVVSVLPLRPAGCPPLSQELYRGAFTDPGRVLCVQLPHSTGQSIVELVPTGTRYPLTRIYDGAALTTCALPAGPLTVILNAAEADATYELTRQP